MKSRYDELYELCEKAGCPRPDCCLRELEPYIDSHKSEIVNYGECLQVFLDAAHDAVRNGGSGMNTVEVGNFVSVDGLPHTFDACPEDFGWPPELDEWMETYKDTGIVSCYMSPYCHVTWDKDDIYRILEACVEACLTPTAAKAALKVYIVTRGDVMDPERPLGLLTTSRAIAEAILQV